MIISLCEEGKAQGMRVDFDWNWSQVRYAKNVSESLDYTVGEAKVRIISYVHRGRWHTLSIRQHVVDICYHMPWHKVSGSFLGVVLQYRTVPVLLVRWSLQHWNIRVAFSVTQCSVVVSLFTLKQDVGSSSFKYLTFPQNANFHADENY